MDDFLVVIAVMVLLLFLSFGLFFLYLYCTEDGDEQHEVRRYLRFIVLLQICILVYMVLILNTILFYRNPQRCESCNVCNMVLANHEQKHTSLRRKFRIVFNRINEEEEEKLPSKNDDADDDDDDVVVFTPETSTETKKSYKEIPNAPRKRRGVSTASYDSSNRLINMETDAVFVGDELPVTPKRLIQCRDAH